MGGTSLEISVNTVRRSLKNQGFIAKKNIKKPLLTGRLKKARLDFATKYQAWTIDDWKKVVWSDESKINLFGSDGLQFI